MITLSSAEFPYNNFVATYRTASSLENRKGQSGLVNNSDYVSQGLAWDRCYLSCTLIIYQNPLDFILY